jgi:acetamidase/formamidase
VLRINSADRVTSDTLSGARQFVPKLSYHVLPDLAEVHARAERFEGCPHILTGPISIKGAKPGRVLRSNPRRQAAPGGAST